MTLNREQVARLVVAIDSHIYWQLSDDRYRGNGAVREPGSNDPIVAADIAAFEALQDELTNAGAVEA